MDPRNAYAVSNAGTRRGHPILHAAQSNMTKVYQAGNVHRQAGQEKRARQRSPYAGLGLTQEAPNEILILANDREQALSRVFAAIEGMVQHSEPLKREC